MGATPATVTFDPEASQMGQMGQGHPCNGGDGGDGGGGSSPPVGRGWRDHQTGIRLSVSRRLSEHSHRQRVGYTGHSGAGGDGVGVATPKSQGEGTPRFAGGVSRQFLPVLDFGELPEVEETLGEDVATLRVLSAPHNPPPEERATGTASTQIPGANPNVRLEISVAMLADSTTAVEVALSSGILQWPYFQDMSLVSWK